MVEKIVPRWPRVVAAILTSLASGVLFTWSYFRGPLIALFPTWTHGDLSFVFSMHNMVVGIVMFFAGFIMRRVSSRTMFAFAAVMTLIGLGGFRFLPVDQPQLAFFMVTVLYGVVAPIGLGICAIAQFAIYTQWTPERAGLMGGAMLMAYGSCAFIMGAVAGILIPRIEILPTISIIGAICALLVSVSTIFGAPPEPGVKLPPAPPRKENKAGKDYTAYQMIKTPLFWIMYIYGTSIFAAGLIFADHAAAIALYFGAAAMFGMLFSPAKGLSSVFGGWIIDKMSVAGGMSLFAVTLAISSASLIVGNRLGSSALILFGLVMGGVSFGGASSVRVTATRFLFGNKYYSQNYSVATTVIFISSIICYIAGRIVANSGYIGVFIVTMVLAAAAILCSVIFILSLRRVLSSGEAEVPGAEPPQSPSSES